MQPLRVERISAPVEVNGHANGNGHTNGNGKSRRSKAAAEQNGSAVLVEAGGK
jgi:hypothetical protein